MVETQQKYDFESIYKKLSNHKKSVEDAVEITRIDICLYKLSNIIVLIKNIDNDLLDSIINAEYKNLYESINSITQENFDILNVLKLINEIFLNILSLFDFNVLINNREGIKKNIKNYKIELNKIRNSLELELEELKTIVNDEKEKFESNDSELNTRFVDLNNKLDETSKKQLELEEQVKSFANESKSKIEDDFEEKYKQLSEEYEGKFEELLKKLQQQDKQISELIGIVAGKANMGEYGKNADKFRKERFFWHFITIFLFIIGFGLTIYFTLKLKSFNEIAILKYIVSFILMGASGYTGKQASNARKDELYCRKQQLELASIDVYLESVDETIRKEIKRDLSSKIFGQAQNTYKNKNNDTNNLVAQMLEELKASTKSNN